MTATAFHGVGAELRSRGLIGVEDSTLAWALYSSDASLYRVVPQMVVKPQHTDEPGRLLLVLGYPTMADAAMLILAKRPWLETGHCYVDSDVLRSAGRTDLSVYAAEPGTPDSARELDLFL